MKHFTNLVLSSVCAVALLSGCSGKDGDPGPAGATGATGATGPAGTSGQNLTGAMFGFVNPVDEFGSPVAKNGVTVTLEGVTPAATATTNSDGRYEFTNLRNGTYNIAFSRTGLSTYRRISVAHVGGDQPTFLGTSSLTAPSTTTFGTVVVNSIVGGSVNINIPYSNLAAPSNYFLRTAIYVSATTGVNSTNGTFLMYAYPNSSLNSNSGTISTTISRSTLNNAGFATGTAVYIVAYGVPSLLTGQTDATTGKTIYNGLSATSSNQVAFIVP
ncbi:carboxypeptidase-like regulatory domain-containing protein [Hymenobacter sp. YC55]|uniref:carboxypeptidase-like regulatory domain-containing protein n=1 Tax=Hymenobacter sp. YC55 TaxID=3034019 RepID=UPI0023F81719|nr:carboxypeptidase-like regulatory domain-containing protein [Hymenobacter sp. YC55]MDF7814616.1 carboxypeptidase-like regulatory domain-containing protein [Hymenobacter sp. YC55]